MNRRPLIFFGILSVGLLIYYAADYLFRRPDPVFYKVCWKYKTEAKQGCGEPFMDYKNAVDLADAWVKRLNSKYPEIHHYRVKAKP